MASPSHSVISSVSYILSFAACSLCHICVSNSGVDKCPRVHPQERTRSKG
ncbi:rCG57186 [Rattus norvegicus]|uniref:RCG57186 n=1 Tax=Rattus norvegicus TaxID=10116 RepID=A6KPJ7_RAT|nr:rCG57186 [Rattus norvegicus]